MTILHIVFAVYHVVFPLSRKLCLIEVEKLRIFASVITETIKLDDVSTAYEKQGGIVTARFSAVLSAGDFVCVLGGNGSGKSTLLRTMAGFQRPAAGRVAVCGRDIALCSRRELARTIGVVLTEREMFNTLMTVEELVSLGRIPYTGFTGTLSAVDRRIVVGAMRLTGMDGMARHRVSTLSDGERQKTMIAKCLAQQTPVILLDEPTAFLDFQSKVETFRLLRNIAKDERKTIVVSTHDLGTAFRVADSLWVMRRSMPPVCGTPRGLAETGALDVFFKGCNVDFNRDALTYSIFFENGI